MTDRTIYIKRYIKVQRGLDAAKMAGLPRGGYKHSLELVFVCSFIYRENRIPRRKNHETRPLSGVILSTSAPPRAFPTSASFFSRIFRAYSATLLEAISRARHPGALKTTAPLVAFWVVLCINCPLYIWPLSKMQLPRITSTTLSGSRQATQRSQPKPFTSRKSSSPS